MSLFRKARKNETLKIEHPDDPSTYIEVRAEMTRKDANSLARHLPKGENDVEGVFTLTDEIFNALVVGWSYLDDDDNPVAPALSELNDMESSVARWVDRTVQERFRKLMGLESEETEGKPLT